MKDNFSVSPGQYAKYRPDYPQAMFDFIYPLLNEKAKAWDCGTGSGQVALELAKDFHEVEATDISEQQLKYAFQADNIHYSAQPAEKTTFENNTFDLITVAQAVHWFDFDKFNTEVKRVGKPNGIIALIGYELNNITPEIDTIIRRFYTDIIGNYWDDENKHIQNKYQTIPFPFRELETPEINNIKLWRFDHLIGYLNTWSAVHNFIEKNNYNPISEIEDDLRVVWGIQEVRRVIFPIIFRVGRIK
ncbi:MAG: class I SAM-dependent methyltransferase [Sphingobacterium composti]|uniref:class I SAM-dependent methyltransferase n=1 Tax=Sphingobacterium composti TaxID=363260 RepID=UPI0013569DC0|nr:class I SAM-dependent methyltransferase [Sphingobacterium composti Ten et al. 2007 non Yoo et al. 2007]